MASLIPQRTLPTGDAARLLARSRFARRMRLNLDKVEDHLVPPEAPDVSPIFLFPHVAPNNPTLCLAVVSGNRTDFLTQTLTAVLTHMRDEEPEIEYELVMVDNNSPEKELQGVLSTFQFDKVVRVTGNMANIGPHTAHNLIFFNLCHAPFTLSLEDDFPYQKMNASNSHTPISKALDVLRHDDDVALVNMRFSSPGREWTAFQETAEKWNKTVSGTIYKRFSVVPEGWGALPYGGILFRRDAARVVGPFNVAVDPDRSENHFSRKMGLKFKAAFVQLQECDTEESRSSCTEEMTKAFYHIGARRSDGWTNTRPDYVTWTQVSSDKPVNPPFDDPIFAYEATTAGSKTNNPLLITGSCEPEFDLKVYIYELPDRFWKNALEDHKNCNSSQVCYWHSCSTGPFALETRLHSMLLNSSYRTMDPEEADVFYVPLHLVCNLLAPSTGVVSESTYFAEMLQDVATWLRSSGPWFDRFDGVDHVWPFFRDFGAHTAMVPLLHGTVHGDQSFATGPPVNRKLGKMIRNGVFVGHFGVTPGSSWPGAWTYRRGRDIVVPTVTYHPQIVELERRCMKAATRGQKSICVDSELVPNLTYAQIDVTSVRVAENGMDFELAFNFTRPLPKGRAVRFSLELQRASNSCGRGPDFIGTPSDLDIPGEFAYKLANCSADAPVELRTKVTVQNIDRETFVSATRMDVFLSAACVDCTHVQPIFLRGLHGLDERAKIAVLHIEGKVVNIVEKPTVGTYLHDPAEHEAVFGGSFNDKQYVMFRRKTGVFLQDGVEEIEVDSVHYANGQRHRMLQNWQDDPLVDVFSHDMMSSRCDSYMEALGNARFGIHAAGWSPWTQRFHETLAAATVPVVVSPDYEFPYEELIDHSKYTVKVHDEKIISRLGAFLQSIPGEVVASKRSHLQYALTLQTWEDDRDEPGACNAFRLFIVSLSRRARRFKNGMNSTWV